MKEILSKLLESDLLSEETKVDITKNLETYVSDLTESIRHETRLELSQEFVKAQDQLVEAIDKKLSDVLKSEIRELKEDIEAFKDLEVEYAEKLVEEKQKIASTLAEEIDSLVDKIDSFLDQRISIEVQELKEDIEDVQKIQFGKKIFESFEQEFIKHRNSDTSVLEQRLAEATDRASDLKKQLKQLESQNVKEERSSKLNSLLENVEGLAKDQLKVLLSNVSTEKLDEAYKTYAPRVLKESLTKMETKIINESKVKDKTSTILITGNEGLNEDTIITHEQEAANARLRKLAGIS